MLNWNCSALSPSYFLTGCAYEKTNGPSGDIHCNARPEETRMLPGLLWSGTPAAIVCGVFSQPVSQTVPLSTNREVRNELAYFSLTNGVGTISSALSTAIALPPTASSELSIGQPLYEVLAVVHL